MTTPAIETILTEDRRYPPPEDFAAQANAQPDIYDEDFDTFWEREGRERISWFEPFTQLYEWKPPYAKWFLGGKTNVTYNCVDRHVEAGLGDKVAYYWEGEPVDDRREITFADLQRETTKLANALKAMGVRKGTPVGIYMGMVPETPVAMLACARIGAPHTVVFGGFSADSLSDRLQDMECEVLITQDEAWRRGTTVPLKRTADEAVAASPTVKNVVVLRRTGNDVPMQEGRDHWWHDVATDETAYPCEPMDSEDLLYLLYTSGTTAKPKGIVHTTAGYLVGVASTHHYIFDVKPDSVYWCAADVGWVTGHSYIVYGPLTNGTTGVLYEGTPDFPDKDRWWEIVERYKVDILYTAPTAIRAHMKWGTEHAEKHDLSSLRLLGLGRRADQPRGVGVVPPPHRRQPHAGRRHVVADGDRDDPDHAAPGRDHDEARARRRSRSRASTRRSTTSRGTRSGRAAGATSCCVDRGRRCCAGSTRRDDRYRETYWSKYDDVYFAGDGARIDRDGDFWLLGRVDDVMNVSGHRISTIEVESALVDHPSVAEAAVCGRTDAQTGQAIVAYVTLKGTKGPSVEMLEELRNHVAHKIGPIAKPANIVFTPELPKTRSGKIMRRLLRDVAEERTLGDTTTLADPAVVEEIRDRAASEKTEE